MTMTGLPPADGFRAAAAGLATIHAEIVELSKRSDDDWRRDLIALRRRLQQQIVALSQLMGTMPENDDTKGLRIAFSRMRSTVALHQASWPAVAIDRDDAAYKQSVSDVRAANTDFLAVAAKHFSSTGMA